MKPTKRDLTARQKSSRRESKDLNRIFFFECKSSQTGESISLLCWKTKAAEYQLPSRVRRYFNRNCWKFCTVQNQKKFSVIRWVIHKIMHGWYDSLGGHGNRRLLAEFGGLCWWFALSGFSLSLPVRTMWLALWESAYVVHIAWLHILHKSRSRRFSIN